MNKKEQTPLAEKHEKFKLEFDKIISVSLQERMDCLSDRRFALIRGAQWEGAVGKQFENKPKFEINKVQLGLTKLKNDYLNNRITVDFKSKTGEENDKLANTCDMLYRADEKDSDAEEAYDNAFEEGSTGGMGAWRLSSDYEDEYDLDNEYQRIKFIPIYDADSCVFFDLGSKRQDKSDAKRGYILTRTTVDDYKDLYGDDPVSWPKDVSQAEFDWCSGDDVYLAEVYEIEEITENWVIFELLDGTTEKYREEDLEENSDISKRLKAISATRTGSRPIKVKKIHKYIMSGARIEEDCQYIPGDCIPIIVYFGKRAIVDGIERTRGHVRPTRDSQVLKNIQVSKLGSIAATSSIEKPIFTPDQVRGHTEMWSKDNIEEYPYMLINLIEHPNGEDTVAGPLGYTKSPNVPPALVALLQQTEIDLKELLGNSEKVDELQPNLSGIAVELIYNRIDMQSFEYLSNFAKAQQRCGRIWLGMARDLYIEDKRKMLGIDKRGNESSLILNNPVKEGVKTTYENDLAKAKFKVFADVGPSSDTKRQSLLRTLTTVLGYTKDPELINLINSLIMMNIEGEGIEEIRGYFRKKLIRMGVLRPNKKEEEELLVELQNAKPDPNSVYLEAAAKKEEAQAEEAKAKTFKTLVETENTRADTPKTLSDIESEDIRKAQMLNQSISNEQSINPPQGEER